MRKKTAEQKIRAFILAGEQDNRVIAEKAKCTRAYVYQVRHRMKNEQYSKTQAKLIAMTQQDPRYGYATPRVEGAPVDWGSKITMIEPEESEPELWVKVVVVVCVVILVAAIIKIGVSHV